MLNFWEWCLFVYVCATVRVAWSLFFLTLVMLDETSKNNSPIDSGFELAVSSLVVGLTSLFFWILGSVLWPVCKNLPVLLFNIVSYKDAQREYTVNNW